MELQIKNAKGKLLEKCLFSPSQNIEINPSYLKSGVIVEILLDNGKVIQQMFR
ncbi:MAG: hypothetical protein MUF45_06475 [Spirosomaceae bacterium]|jgi:hypothetical protein|nr:hypothetical protein [Spirosomataceae bacterium]